MLIFLCCLVGSLKTVMFQLSGFYCRPLCNVSGSRFQRIAALYRIMQRLLASHMVISNFGSVFLGVLYWLVSAGCSERSFCVWSRYYNSTDIGLKVII